MPYVFDMDYYDGYFYENESLKYSVLARIDDEEVLDKVLPLPDFSTFENEDTLIYLKDLFENKIEVENKKSTPNVGYPVDYLLLIQDKVELFSEKSLEDITIY